MQCKSGSRCLQVDVKSKRCQEQGCTKLASYGFPGGRKDFCLEHKSADMVSYWCPCLWIHFVHAALCDQQCLQDSVHCDSVPRCLQVDVVSKRCQEPGCTKHASFGFLGGHRQFCAKHKSADMVCHPGVSIPSCTLADWAVPSPPVPLTASVLCGPGGRCPPDPRREVSGCT